MCVAADQLKMRHVNLIYQYHLHCGYHLLFVFIFLLLKCQNAWKLLNVHFFLQNIVQDAISGMGEMGRNARVSTRTSVSKFGDEGITVA